MTEALIHYIWQTRQYNAKDLRTTRGHRLFIIHPGYLNRDAGPDFLHAKVTIDGTLWAGHIELHLRSSDWDLHGHSSDPAYSNVVLHVVLEHDMDIHFPGHGVPIPELELRPRISGSLVSLYRQFHENRREFACEEYFPDVDASFVAIALQRMAVERLEDKSRRAEQLVKTLRQDWQHCLIALVARSLAGPVNADSAETLVCQLDPVLILRSRDDLLKLESLFLGAAGLLDRPKDDYSRRLHKEFLFWQQKHHIKPLPIHLWKYSRMRPENFIDLRLAQLAAWIHYNDTLWSKLLSCRSWKELRSLFQIRHRHYWSEHFRLGKRSERKVRSLGDSTIRLILINALSPLIFHYGRHQGDPQYQERAMNWLSDIPPEENRVTRSWRPLGLSAENGLESQALIHWKRNYCDEKACARCPVGHHLFTKLAEPSGSSVLSRDDPSSQPNGGK